MTYHKSNKYFKNYLAIIVFTILILNLFGCSNSTTLKDGNDRWEVEISGNEITIERKEPVKDVPTIHFEIMPQDNEESKIEAEGYEFKDNKISISFSALGHFPEDKKIIVIINWDNNKDTLELKR